MFKPPRFGAPLDRIDIHILATLFRDARISKVKMAEIVGLSPTRCHERMRRLERSGIIAGYHADVEMLRLVEVSTFIVQVKVLNYTPAKAQQFEALVRTVPEIIACHAVLGAVDYIMTVLATSIEKYQNIIDHLQTGNVWDFDFVTYPVSKKVKSHQATDMAELVQRMANA